MGIIYCADIIASYGDGYVMIERLMDGGRLALPGGKQMIHNGIIEKLSDTALRELFEETGLTGVITSTFSTVAEPGRDPRGMYVSTVFVMKASGTLRGETGKTRPRVLTQHGIERQYPRYMFDHANILRQFFAQN